MNNTSRFPNHVNYPDISVDNFKQARSKTKEAGIEVKRLFTQTQYLPTLHDRISALDSAMRSSDFTLKETVQSLGTLLGIHIDSLRDLQKELQNAPEADKEEIIEDIALKVNGILDIVKKHETTLDNLIPSLTNSFDRSATQGYVTQLEADEIRLPEEVLNINKRQEALVEKRATLTAAMAQIEAKGFDEITKEAALTAQELTKLGMQPPELAAIEKGIELAQQVLEKAGVLINYMGLIEARDAVSKQTDDLNRENSEKTAELRLVTLKKELITVCHQFDDERKVYVTEFEKCRDSKRSFVNTYTRVEAHDQDAIAQFAVDARSLAKHLKAAI